MTNTKRNKGNSSPNLRMAAPAAVLKKVKPSKADVAWAAGLPWTEDLIKQLELTPGRAAALHARFMNNNRIAPTHHVVLLADIFENGAYDHRIALMHGSTRGKMVNGSNRLQAFMHARLSVKVNIQFGVPPSKVKWIDIPWKRNGADSIRMQTGWSPSQARWANRVLKCIHTLDTGTPNTYTPDVALRYLKAWRAEIEWAFPLATELAKLQGSAARFRSHTFWGPIVLAYRYAPRKTMKFAKEFMTLDNVAATRPSFMLRNHRFVQEPGKYTNKPVRVVEKLTLRALHADIKRQAITVLNADRMELEAALHFFFEEQS